MDILDLFKAFQTLQAVGLNLGNIIAQEKDKKGSFIANPKDRKSFKQLVEKRNCSQGQQLHDASVHLTGNTKLQRNFLLKLLHDRNREEEKMDNRVDPLKIGEGLTESR